MKPSWSWIAACFLTLVNTIAITPSPCQMGHPPVGDPIIYKVASTGPLSLYVTEPEHNSTTPRAAVIFFFGGGWVGGGPGQFNQQAAAVAQHGAVAIEVQYRLLQRQEKGPPSICVEDAKSAVRWVRSHSSVLNIDPNKIVAAGGSAGGYMAAYTAMVPGWDDPSDPSGVSPKPNALVLFNPVLDNSPSGYGNQRFGGEYQSRSPLFFVKNDTPPTLIMSGGADKWIKPAVLHDFQSQMRADGVRCDVVIYDGQPHGFFNKDPYLEQTTQEMLKFLTSLGYLN